MKNTNMRAGVLETAMALSKRILFMVSALALVFGCATATKQPSLFQTNPALLTRQYTPVQISLIHQNFKANPVQYSQELGDLLLWQMHKKRPEFALEFAQTPELNDGIDQKEAKAIKNIYDLIKDLDIPPDLFTETHKPRDIDKIIMRWKGNSDAKSDWSGHFYQSPGGKILDAKPIDFEQAEDQIDHKRLAENGELKWKSMSASGDEDGIKITLKYPRGGKIMFDINHQLLLSFTKTETVVNPFIQFDEKNGLEGTLTINEDLERKLPTEICALRDIVLAGENDYRYSAPLQALLWAYIDGKFKENDNPLKDYRGILDFIKPSWGDMKGPKWKKFEDVAERVNTIELFNYWVNNTITYGDPALGYTKTAEKTFKDKKGDCSDIAELGQTILSRAGYNVIKICRPSHVMAYIKENGLYWLAIDFTETGNHLIGPFEKKLEMSKYVRGPIMPCGPSVEP